MDRDEADLAQDSAQGQRGIPNVTVQDFAEIAQPVLHPSPRKLHMWWITYRGEGRQGVDNIGVFEDDGRPRSVHPLLLDTSSNARPLHIARGFALVGEDLYIANAWRKDSYIARYRREGDFYRYDRTVVSTDHVEAMVHPFDLVLGDDGHIYVSCQDTNTVIAILPEKRVPAPVALHLIFCQGRMSLQVRGACPKSASKRRRTCRRLWGLRSCSTNMAGRVIRYVGSPFIKDTCTSQTKQQMR